MSINEEPKSATEPAGALDDESTIIDLDDVEGHGMREVAVGLGTAAILAGGGTAAAAAMGVHPSLPHVKAPTPSISDPIGAVDRTTDRGIQITRDARDAAIDTAARTAAGAAATAGHQVSATSATAAAVSGGAQRTADAFVEAGGNIAATQVKAAGAATRAAVSSAGAVVSGTQSTASSTTATATTAASSATTDAVRKAATVLQLTTSTVNALETTVVATVENLNPELGAGTSGMGSTGWVTFSVGGENIASVQVSHGQATITVKTSSLGGKVLQAVYSGDALNASSMRTMTM